MSGAEFLTAKVVVQKALRTTCLYACVSERWNSSFKGAISSTSVHQKTVQVKIDSKDKR